VKLLLDHNLSFRVLRAIFDLYPNSMHVGNVGLAEAHDEDIWEYAKQNALIIVSKDSDFHHMSFVRGAPPKVIYLKLGNCSTNLIAQMLRVHYPAIEQFASDPGAAFLLID
jgi:predicted nuclease of predicted toxin-antitoxin system